jgi:hypothetical protein
VPEEDLEEVSRDESDSDSGRLVTLPSRLDLGPTNPIRQSCSSKCGRAGCKREEVTRRSISKDAYTSWQRPRIQIIWIEVKFEPSKHVWWPFPKSPRLCTTSRGSSVM